MKPFVNSWVFNAGQRNKETLRKAMDSPDPGHLAAAGTRIALRVTPRASRARLVEAGDGLRAYVTVPPDAGRANAALQMRLPRAVGVQKSRPGLVRGESGRDKTFEVL